MGEEKVTKPLAAAAILTGALALQACLARTGCEAGNVDGAWEIIGQSPPPTDDLTQLLIGKDLSQATRALAGGFVQDEVVEGVQFARLWVFEARKKSAVTDCLHPDHVSVTQGLLIVRGQLSDGLIKGCSVQTRTTIGGKILSIPELLALPPGPLDGVPKPCS